jgi:hypothetical protein
MFAKLKWTGVPRAMVAMGATMFSGDFVCQYIEKEKSSVDLNILSLKGDRKIQTLDLFDNFEWNVSRSFRMGVTGALCSGPLSQGTYMFTSTYLSHFSAFKNVVFICLLAPVNISCTMAFNFWQADFSTQDIFRKLKRDVPTTWILNSLYWPWCLYYNVTRVPLINRGAVGSIFWFFWSIALSLCCNLNLDVK